MDANRSIYPRVLIIYNSRINKEDQHGVSIRGWFGNWPKENLAQIYSGGEDGDEVFCKFNFKLGKESRRFGKYFFKLKDSSLGKSSYPIVPKSSNTKIDKPSLIKNRVSNYFIKTGLWEVIFKPILSVEMNNFIKMFNPEFIYCQGYNLTFTCLPVIVHNKFKIPICFQTGDDWPSNLYNDSFLSFLIKPIVERAVTSLLSSSSVRLANSSLMAEVYYRRYGKSFEPLMMCDDLGRFRASVPNRVVGKEIISIVYAGGLGHKRWRSIIDLCEASKLLQVEGYSVIVTAFATEIPQEAISFLLRQSNLQILPGPSHEKLPSFLKGADILFLPESFDPEESNSIKLSLSTKAHLYMMSEKVILVYAPRITGTMKYAEEDEWAYNVKENNLSLLSHALRNLIVNEELRCKLVKKGFEVALQNHDEERVRSRFLTILKENV